jgi:hypothetical protein
LQKSGFLEKEGIMNKLAPRLFAVLAWIIIFLPACSKNEATEGTAGTGKPAIKAVAFEIDPGKLANAVGVNFRILKEEAVAQTTRNKFYWISVGDKVAVPKIEELAMAVIRETIAARPQTYHSFTLHFIRESDLKETPESSAVFVRATYLPEGSWQKVGRVSIEDYKDYRLHLTLPKKK